MTRLIIFILVAAGLYFAYVNFDKINSNVDKSVKQTTQQLQNEKTINAVGSGRERAVEDTNKTINKAF